MQDVLFEWMINRLVADATVGSTTAGRVLKGHISGLTNPVYPLVTLYRHLPGDQDSDAPASVYTFQAAAWSTQSYEQAYELMDAVRTSLHNSNYADATNSLGFYIKAHTTPVEYSDDSPTPAYACSIIFEVHQIGP